MLTKPQLRFLEQHNLTGTTFSMDEKSLLNAETISEKLNIKDKYLVEKILNLPSERQEELIWQLKHKPGIDIELATNPKLNEAQFREHLNISHYNYEIEYGNLKDSGRTPVNKSFIINPELSSNQLYMIHQAASENLLLHRLVNTHHQGLSETEMRKEIDEMRINKLAVNQALGEVGKLYDISQSHRALLDDLHINGKSDPEKSNLFHKLINSEANERQTRTAIAEIQPDVERRAAVAFGLDPYKFDGYNMYQSQLIKCAANYHGGIDPTPYITPDTESGEIATIIRIIEQSDPSCNNPLNYSPEQILAFRKLTHDTLEYETPLAYTIMNPEYSVDEMNYIVSWAQQNNLDEAFKFIPGDYDIPQMIEEYRQNSELQEQFKNKQTEVKAEAEMFANSNLSTELPEESLHAKINQLEQSYEKYTTELEAVQNSQKAYLIKYETETGKEFIAVDSKNELLHYLQQEHPSRFDSLSPDRFWNAIESPDVDEMVRQSLNASQDLYENGSLSEYAFAISHYHEVEPPEVKDISDLKEQYQEQQSDLEH